MADTHSPSPDAATEVAMRVVLALKHQPGALLPVLHGIQDELGFIPPSAISVIASELNLSRAEVHGVVTFYHHFRSAKPPRHTVQICRAEACQAMGADKLAAHVERRLGCGLHEASADGEFSVEPVYCLGLCAQSPAMMIDDEIHARVTPEKLDRVLEAKRGRNA